MHHLIDDLSEKEVEVVTLGFHAGTVIPLYLQPDESLHDGEFIFGDEGVVVSFTSMCNQLGIEFPFHDTIDGLKQFARLTRKTIMVTHDGFTKFFSVDPDGTVT